MFSSAVPEKEVHRNLLGSTELDEIHVDSSNEEKGSARTIFAKLRESSAAKSATSRLPNLNSFRSLFSRTRKTQAVEMTWVLAFAELRQLPAEVQLLFIMDTYRQLFETTEEKLIDYQKQPKLKTLNKKMTEIFLQQKQARDEIQLNEFNLASLQDTFQKMIKVTLATSGDSSLAWPLPPYAAFNWLPTSLQQPFSLKPRYTTPEWNQGMSFGMLMQVMQPDYHARINTTKIAMGYVVLMFAELIATGVSGREDLLYPLFFPTLILLLTHAIHTYQKTMQVVQYDRTLPEIQKLFVHYEQGQAANDFLLQEPWDGVSENTRLGISCLKEGEVKQITEVPLNPHALVSIPSKTPASYFHFRVLGADEKAQAEEKVIERPHR